MRTSKPRRPMAPALAVAGFSVLALAAPVTAHAAVLNPELPSVRAAEKASSTVKTASLPVEQSAAKPKAPPTPTLHATIDLTNQRMIVRAGGKTLHSWKISSGRAGYETPTGRFKPQWMARDWYSRKYDMAPMPYAVFFNGGIATHGTTATGRLGQPASHGCIRLRTPNARAFYNLVRKHSRARTRIVVTGTTPQRTPAVAKRRQRRTQPAYAARTPRYRPERRVYRYVRPQPYVDPRRYRYTERVYRPAPQYRFVYPGDRPRYRYDRY